MALRFPDLQKIAQAAWTGRGTVAFDAVAMRVTHQCVLVHPQTGASIAFDLARKDLELDAQAFGEKVLAEPLAALKEKIGG